MSRAGPLRAGSAGARVCPGVAGVAHSRMLRVGGNRGIMRNSTISNGHGLAPMCADPPHHTWEPNHHTPRSPKKPVIPTKTSLGLTKAPVSHVQHQRQPHPKHAPTAPHTEIGPVPHRDRSNSARPTRRRSTHDKLEGENHMPHLGNRRQTAHPRKHDRSRHGLRPISSRSKTDLDASFDRSRGGTGPISARVSTDLAAEPDRSRRGGGEGMTKGRAGPRAARPLGVGRRRREETATPSPLALFPCQAREMREASSTCSGVGRTPV